MRTLRPVTALLAAALTAIGLLGAATPAQATPAVPLTVGANDLGQQGDGGTASRLLPGPTAGPAATAIASGRDHGYLLDDQGRVWGWGQNTYGAVGDGTTVNRRVPTLTSLTGVTRIEAGHYHGLAVTSTGRLYTWGMGSLGQLGLGTTGNRTTPTAVPGITTAVAAAGGRDMSHALLSDGTVLGWGSNALGEVGDGTTVRRLSPVPVPGLTGVVEIAEGRNHVLARTSNGAVWAWGDNTYGQLGDGTTTMRSAPVLVIGSGVIGLDAGAHHSVALKSDGTVLTWGRGYRGQLGLGSTTSRSTPSAVPGLSSIVEIGDGRDQTFAVTATGQVWAWGSNGAGQLGDSTTTTRTSPVLLGLTGVAAVQSGSSHTVFLPVGTATPQPPVATFTRTCTLLDCQFDGSGSNDPDGQIVSYAWDFGDATAGSGAAPVHSYATAGTYPVSLTVVDETGLSATSSASVTVSGPSTSQVEFVATAGANANLTTHRVTIPSQVLPGDGLVLVLSTANTSTPSAPSGTGWQSVTTVVGSDTRTQVWARPAVVGDAGRVVSVTMPALTKAALSVSAYRGSTSAVVTASATAAETTSTTVHVAPPVAVTVPGSVLLTVWSDKSSATTTITPPAGLTTRYQSSGAGSGRVTTTLADSVPPVGSTTALAATANSASSKATMLSLVIAPV